MTGGISHQSNMFTRTIFQLSLYMRARKSKRPGAEPCARGERILREVEIQGLRIYAKRRQQNAHNGYSAHQKDAGWPAAGAPRAQMPHGLKKQRIKTGGKGSHVMRNKPGFNPQSGRE